MGIRSHLKRAVSAKFLLLPLAAMGVVAVAAQTDAAQPRWFRGSMPTAAMRPIVKPDLRVAASLQYGGGPVLSNVEIVIVQWGNLGSTITQGISNAPGFFGAITGSSYFDWLAEYDTAGQTGGTNQHINRGTYKTSVTITPTNTSTSLQDADIGTELSAQIAAGHIPPPTAGEGGYPDTMYMVYFPSGVGITDPSGNQSCNVGGGFCAYHSSTTMTVGGTQHQVAFGVIPDINACGGGCGGTGSLASDYTVVVSHEMIEAVTDTSVATNNTAWYDNQNGEIGDICAPGQSATGAGVGTVPDAPSYQEQTEWSNRLNSCITNDPNLPTCTGSNRPCKGCTAAQCTGNTPVCGTNGVCGPCTATAGCTAPLKCDTTTGGCVACIGNSDCSGGTPICDTTSHQCRACNSNNDCASSSGGHACATSGGNAGKCVACATSADCTSPQVCDTTSNTCVACVVSTDCHDPNNPQCDTSTHTCGPCTGTNCPIHGADGGIIVGADGGPILGGPDASIPNNPGNNTDTTTSSSSGCSAAPSSAAPTGAIAGLLLGLAAFARKRSKK